MAQDIDLKSLIRTVPDFPRPGVLFRDITTLLKQADAFHAVVEQLGAAYRGRPIDKVAAIESRGFIIGAALAYALNAGFVPIRKQGKLPAENFGQDYQLEYGADRLEVHSDGLQRGERVLLVDDLIATGGTAEAALRLIGINSTQAKEQIVQKITPFVPTILGKLMQDKDAEKSNRVMKAMLQMTKIDIEGLKRAYEQR
jgi:adenine phosphoribosyltransferase